MSKKNIIILIVLIFVIFSGFLFFNSPIISRPTTELRYENIIPEEITVYDFMDKMRNEGKIDFTDRNYVGIGKFIVSINGIKGNGSQNWIYYVNDKKMETGVSNYKINQGDIVSWKYEQNY